MHSLEPSRIETFFQLMHRAAQHMRFFGGVHAHVVAGGIDPLYRSHVDTHDAMTVTDRKFFFPSTTDVAVQRVVEH